jgi:hypothetical protein
VAFSLQLLGKGVSLWLLRLFKEEQTAKLRLQTRTSAICCLCQYKNNYYFLLIKGLIVVKSSTFTFHLQVFARIFRTSFKKSSIFVRNNG